MSDKTPFHLRGNYAPVTEECTATDLPVEGAIPPEICGSYVRNGPNPKSGTSPHWFSGDGMLHAVRLEGGRALSYRNRWVRTRSFLEEDAKLIGDDGVDLTVAVANTNIVRHAGDWLALVESSFPTRVNAELETLGQTDFGGRLRTAFTAHPKFCPETGEMHFFGYGFFEPFLTYHRVNAAGELVQSEEIDVTGPTMVHDFAITRNHVIFLDLPVVFDLEAAMQRFAGPEGETSDAGDGDGMPYHWSDDYPARIGVMERGVAGAQVRWSAIDPCYIFHPWNAFERDGHIVLDACRYPELWREGTGSFDAAKPHRFEIDPAAGRVHETPLFETDAEFPRIDDRRCGLTHRYGYAASLGDDISNPSNQTAIVKHDFVHGEETRWEPGAGCVPGEFVFVPSAADAGEDEGWALGFVYDGNRGGSDLVILDATGIERGPVARVRLPQRVPFGFHGNFFADE